MIIIGLCISGNIAAMSLSVWYTSLSMLHSLTHTKTHKTNDYQHTILRNLLDYCAMEWA